ncbi:MAG: dUTP diphosphatase [Janthinobacterium lividum]
MIRKIPVLITALPHARDLPYPTYATSESAGVDLQAAIKNPIYLQPGSRHLIPTGIYIEIPVGYEGQIRSRSGLSLNHGVVVLNSPGTIDSDYRGEIKVVLINLGQEIFTIERGMRIAQFVLSPLVHIMWHEISIDEITETARGAKGFGSTGV